MADPELLLSKKKYVGESTVISTRMPKDMLKDIDALAKETGRTRNEVVQICLEFALKHIRLELMDED